MNEIDKCAIGDVERDEIESFQCHNVKSADAVGKAVKHRSAEKQVTGEAEYLDDLPIMENELYFVPLLSTNANAKIIEVDWTKALQIEGVVGHVDSKDIKGENKVSLVSVL